MTKEPSLIEYPCDFPIKVFGAAHPDFAQAIATVVQAHDAGFEATTIGVSNSKTSRYICLTCTVQATSREQLDALYRDLTSHPMVKMVL